MGYVTKKDLNAKWERDGSAYPGLKLYLADTEFDDSELQQDGDCFKLRLKTGVVTFNRDDLVHRSDEIPSCRPVVKNMACSKEGERWKHYDETTDTTWFVTHHSGQTVSGQQLLKARWMWASADGKEQCDEGYESKAGCLQDLNRYLSER